MIYKMPIDTALNVPEQYLSNRGKRARQASLSLALSKDGEVLTNFYNERSPRGPICRKYAAAKVISFRGMLFLNKFCAWGGANAGNGHVIDIFEGTETEAFEAARTFVENYTK